MTREDVEKLLAGCDDAWPAAIGGDDLRSLCTALLAAWEALEPFAEMVEHQEPTLVMAAIPNTDLTRARAVLAHRTAAPDPRTAKKLGLMREDPEGAYVPALIRNETAGYVEFVERDCPTITGDMVAANVAPLLDNDRNVIGYRIYDAVSLNTEPRPMTVVKLWRDHSLSITLVVIGAALMLVSIPLSEGTWFDLISQLGGSFFSVGCYNFLAGPLKERNRPEKEQ